MESMSYIQHDCRHYYEEILSLCKAVTLAQNTGGEIILDGESISDEEALRIKDRIIEEIEMLIDYNDKDMKSKNPKHPTRLTEAALNAYYGLLHDVSQKTALFF